MNKRRRFKTKRRRRMVSQLARYRYYRACAEEWVRLRPMAPFQVPAESQG